MFTSMKIVIRITAIFFSLFLTSILISFSLAVESSESTFGIGIFSLMLSLASQAGLMVSTTKFGENNRAFTTVLMAPMTLFVLVSSYDAVTRLLAGNPPLLKAIVFFWLALAVYIYAFYLLFRSRAIT